MKRETRQWTVVLIIAALAHAALLVRVTAGLDSPNAIDEGARDAAYFRQVLDEEGPVSIEVIRSLGIEPQ